MTDKTPLVILSHRIPYPPNKGDKIRAFNVIKHLSREFDIYLGCMVDNQTDMQHQAELSEYCTEVFAVQLSPLKRYVLALWYLLLNKPITLAFFADSKMHQWIQKTLQNGKVDNALVLSSSMYQYVEPLQISNVVVDLIDVDSDKWKQYAEKTSFPMRLIYQREFSLLRHYEIEIAKRAQKTLLVSVQEANFFRSVVPNELSGSIGHFCNGVNTAFFDPKLQQVSAVAGDIDVVFVGTMDYLSNILSVDWFCKTVWPLVLKENPRATFYIVGANPTQQVKELENVEGVTVTGAVKDVRPYVHASKLVVAPMLVGRGIQNKVLEAMAMAKPVVCTTNAAEGIDTQGLCVEVEDQPQKIAQAISSIVAFPYSAIVNRRWTRQYLQWEHTLRDLPDLLRKEQ